VLSLRVWVSMFFMHVSCASVVSAATVAPKTCTCRKICVQEGTACEHVAPYKYSVPHKQSSHWHLPLVSP
jgi:hypothetical protein